MSRRDRNFWNSDEGKRAQDRARQLRILRIRLDRQPLTKRSAARSKRRNADFAELVERETEIYRALPRDSWPKPRAGVALEVIVSSPQPPRVDSVCKWLLDLLGSETRPAVYVDDRQVEMLHARCWPPYDVREPLMLISARTAADARAALRRRHDPDVRDGFDDLDDRPWDRHRAEAELEFALDDLGYAPDSPESVEERESAEQRVRRTWQSYDLGSVDETIRLVYRAVAEGREGKVSPGATLEQLNSGRLPVFNLGTVPSEHGRGADFKDSFRRALTDFTAAHRWWRSVEVPVGLSIFHAPGPAGKDLDNILLNLVPILIEILEPPQYERWTLDSETTPWISFIEATTVQADEHLPAGDLVVALTNGDRYQSWWSQAEDEVERHLTEW
ncbi:hypothetical protein [Curtobacterium aetherium]|uniref:Uncharacterized protein n=1 Tax=Curtobacterium aetherium TaxID=2841594 RepID=A0ACD1E296_9MICO|nr:hypothetical protein [Curtobacterium sp. L6-1]QWS33050.1 hypothetical protein KM842_12420 [Curtobacterium sp. L6-1]